MSDDKHVKENNTPKPLEIPRRSPPKYCARQLGFSVRDCRCMLTVGGFAPCPPEAIGILEPIEEFRARLWKAGFQWLQTKLPDALEVKDNPARASEVAIGVDPARDHNGFARSALRIVKAGPPGFTPQSVVALPTDLELPPETPEQIAAAVAAERATLPKSAPVLRIINAQPKPLGGKAAGFTGNICANCQSTRMIRNGVCETCLDCFHSGECA